MTHYLVQKVGCENCTQTTLCPDCQRNAAEYQAWADAKARLQAWLDYDANERYAADNAERQYGYRSWYTGDRVGR